MEINNIATTNNVQPEIQALLEKHQPLFTGTGHLKNCEIHLELDEAVTPVAQPACRITHSLKQVVNTKLEEMRKQGIIEKVEGATPWLSPLVIIPKKCGDVCLVVDMRKANTALKRRRIQIPTVNEILQKMQGATVFTELDLYLQLSLAPESRFITALHLIICTPTYISILLQEYKHIWKKITHCSSELHSSIIASLLSNFTQLNIFRCTIYPTLILKYTEIVARHTS